MPWIKENEIWRETLGEMQFVSVNSTKATHPSSRSAKLDGNNWWFFLF